MTETNHDKNPAQRLKGSVLDGGWTIVERVQRKPGQTGSNFSIGYKAKNDEGKIAFVKALDLTWAFQQPDRLKQIEYATRAFNFEADLYEYCNSKSMSKIVQIIAKGKVQVDDSPLGEVDYILMEPAEGDLRYLLTDFSQIELYWACTVIHEVANALRQLHNDQIAHQDVKPSNVLGFLSSQEFKLSDLGAASRRGMNCPRDGVEWAGEWYVAPPEHQFGEINNDWYLRRIPADLYALGSLIVFLFTGLAIYSIAQRHLPAHMHPTRWNGSFPEVLPFLKDAYAKSFEEISPAFEVPLGSDILEIAQELCEPDPTHRGWSRHLGSPTRQYSMERYLSRFGLIKARAKYALKQKIRDV